MIEESAAKPLTYGENDKGKSRVDDQHPRYVLRSIALQESSVDVVTEYCRNKEDHKEYRNNKQLCDRETIFRSGKKKVAYCVPGQMLVKLCSRSEIGQFRSRNGLFREQVVPNEPGISPRAQNWTEL